MNLASPGPPKISPTTHQDDRYPYFCPSVRCKVYSIKDSIKKTHSKHKTHDKNQNNYYRSFHVFIIHSKIKISIIVNSSSPLLLPDNGPVTNHSSADRVAMGKRSPLGIIAHELCINCRITNGDSKPLTRKKGEVGFPYFTSKSIRRFLLPAGFLLCTGCDHRASRMQDVLYQHSRPR